MTDEPTIGRVAKLAAVHLDMARHYPPRGLLDDPVKPTSFTSLLIDKRL